MRVTFDEVRRNRWKSLMLVLVFFILIGAIGLALGYAFLGAPSAGVIIAAVIGVIYTLIVFSAGVRIVLSAMGAKPALKADYPHLYHTVEGLAIAAGVPTPKAYVIKDTALNAFATGKSPKSASITVTTGLMEKLNREELEGVVAHEMSHIKNQDIKVLMLAAVLVGVVILLSDIMLRSFLWGGGRRSNNGGDGKAQIVMIVIGIVLAILAPLIAQLIKLSISRKREYMADAQGAELTRYPQGLANALKKISNDPDPLVDNANRATAHLFISTPFRKKKRLFANMFATHPPIAERIKRLEEM